MPSAPIITVDSLGKRFRLGQLARSGTLRESLTAGARGLWRTLRLKKEARKPGKEDFWALRDVSFEVQPGEVLGIVGRNGAGKSTLLKLLARITAPTQGRITLQGRVASLLEVGTGFHGELSGRENVYLNGAILGMSRAEIRAKFDEIVAFAEVERFIDTPVKRYSSGMYVRLAFAVAAHLEPEILIVDEVLAVGDLEFQRKCLGKLENVTRTEGRTVLFVSHNLASVRQLCTRALLLDQGRLMASGSPAEIISRYVSSAHRDGEAPVPYKHIRGDGHVSILSIRLHSPVEAVREPHYAIFEKVGITLEYRVTGGPCPAAIEFFLLFYGDDGDCVSAIFQGDCGSITRNPGERGSVFLSFTNTLAPGRYLVSAGIFDASRQFLDWVEYAESFQVINGFQDGRNFDQRLGRITLLPEWKQPDRA